MQNPLFKCTKNVTYNLPLREKRGKQTSKQKGTLFTIESREYFSYK